eukprot:6789026-Pyramimonas_sp.AAC.1
MHKLCHDGPGGHGYVFQCDELYAAHLVGCPVEDVGHEPNPVPCGRSQKRKVAAVLEGSAYVGPLSTD